MDFKKVTRCEYLIVDRECVDERHKHTSKAKKRHPRAEHAHIHDVDIFVNFPKKYSPCKVTQISLANTRECTFLTELMPHILLIRRSHDEKSILNIDMHIDHRGSDTHKAHYA